ncbi:hypothetical protein [Acetobacter orleanensis]|uniref:Lipocalin-like domain-containing protein n=1 Tax=Acetobacter orleanensis TaxID=104099 RepID=A0A4Y3TMB7_9PROT|nr:hypothetical protein [Acetobacter orleanensis]KXV62334.1 hypothetical protein AD949_11260 [Acetobacter orleanensis]PCD79447.1 hypothetical protein CO710_07350 [Acetobacter orleanensis]GAN67561.1 hypothetical protein Abol_009_007 [Acetobacter orleanensis JCM 7639]GBR25472.1 hypothetical protein AA0473_0904 [Acetobacter orleanensis NRIC 0473]GEB82579.1 hypothetical protein AOR01nite_10560 [Acetobacter orleanensis]
MKPRFASALIPLSLAFAAPLSAPLSALAATPKAQAPVTQAHYETAVFVGQWAIMAMDPVTVAANKATGPAERLLVTLPESLKKIVGQDKFSLTRASGSTWNGKQGDLTVTFKLVSENSAQIQITGEGTHKLDLPLYRDN